MATVTKGGFLLKLNTRKLVVLSMLIAVEIVLSRFLSISAWNIKIGFAFLPVALAAMLFGPLEAGIIGALADLLGALLFPVGPYFPGFTLTAFLMGAVYGLFLRRDQRMGSILLAVGVHEFALSLLLNTLWISVLYSSPFLPLLVSRLPQVAVLSVVQVVVIRLLAKALPQLRRLLPQGRPSSARPPSPRAERSAGSSAARQAPRSAPLCSSCRSCAPPERF